MAGCPLPDYDKYMRYAAYCELRSSTLHEIKNCGVARPSVNKVCDIVHSKELELSTKYIVDTITPYDDIEVLLNKRFATELNDTYRDFIFEAASEFISALKKLNRPTVSGVRQAFADVIQPLIADLLDV